jgi:ubiquinone/menaquinone biosynthesis C-methylase UbiE
LDAGCANGYSSVKFARARRIRPRGVDYVPEMVEQARLKAAALGDKLKDSIEFDVGDITKLQERSASYDKVVVIRVLINLGTWERQAQGLRECTRVLKPGGVLLLSEATRQGWERLNLLSREWDLEDIPMPAFNQYLDEEQVVSAAQEELDQIEISFYCRVEAYGGLGGVNEN